MKLSVVIPTIGRGARLRRTLEALDQQTTRRGAFEVVVVADEAASSVTELEEVCAVPRSMPVRLLRGKLPGASAARNVGWRAADGRIILFLGDDILGSPTLIERHLKVHEQRTTARVVAVLGAVRWARELRVTPFMRWLERGYQFNYPAIEGEEADWFNFYTANVSVPKEALAEVGGFDEERYPFHYEDLDLGLRLKAIGMRLRYERRATADHLHPTTIEGWQRRMAAVAPVERRWVEDHPELPAWYYDRLTHAAGLPPSRGLGRPLLRWVCPDTRWVGSYVWGSADNYYGQRLAPAFLERWEREDDQTGRRSPPDVR